MLQGVSLSDALQKDLTKTHPDPKDYEFIKGDTQNREEIMSLIGSGFQYVFHFGELVGISACEADPKTTRAINYLGTRNVVDGVLASSHQPRLAWNSSSSVYYISSDGTSFTEDSPLPEPETLDQYCRNKILSERYIGEKSRQSKNFEFVVLRPATVGGLSPRMRIELIPNHITYSLLSIDRFALANPRDCRAMIDIEDLTDFYVSLIGATNWHNGVFNVGNLNKSKQEYASEICELVGLSKDAIVEVAKAGDLRNLTISSDLLRKTYGFSPTRGLAEMINPLVALLRAKPNVFSRISKDPLLVGSEFTNTPPKEFRTLLLAT